MKLLAAIYNLNTLKAVSKYIDSAVLNVPNYSLVYESDFDLDTAIKYCESNGIEVILSINRIFMEQELSEIQDFINKYSNYFFMVSDLGVINIFKSLGLINKVIYDSSTMVCNSIDLEVYSRFNMSAISMSNEIPVTDVIKGYSDTKADILYQVFGRKLMFYSRRKLISCYEDHRSISLPRDNLYIKEETRNELMPIYENSNGYYVYRSYYISLLEEINNLAFLKYAYFESLTLSDNEFESILSIYKEVINQNMPVSEGVLKLKELNLNIQEGFMYSDTIHAKEKIINEKN